LLQLAFAYAQFSFHSLVVLSHNFQDLIENMSHLPM